MWSIVLLILLSLLIIYLFHTRHILRKVPYIEGTTIEIVADDYSEGLPHTSDSNTIRIPEDKWNSSCKEEILTHEMVHIRQRRNQSAWYEFYEREWGYTIYNGTKYFNIRPNPDTSDHPLMVWRNRFILIPEYSPQRTLRNTKLRVWDIQEERFCDIPHEWLDFFEGGAYKIAQKEHPNEIAAEFLTNRPDTPASRILYKWLM